MAFEKERDLYRATPAMTQGLGFNYLMPRTVPLYDKQDKQKRYLNLFQPGSLLRKHGNDMGLCCSTHTCTEFFSH